MRLATVSRLVDLCVERLTLGKKIIRALICAIHVHMRTCVHSYVRACIRTYVRIYARTHVRMYAYEYAYDVFPREPSHAEVFTSRCDTVTRHGTVVCRMYVRTWHVPMCACAHVRTNEYAYDVFPA